MGVTTHTYFSGAAAWTVWLAAAVTGSGVAGGHGQPVSQETQYWLGTIEVRGPRAAQMVPIVVTLNREGTAAENRWSGTLDLSPGPSTPGIRGMALSDVVVAGRAMRFTTPGQGGDATYELGITDNGARAEGRVGTTVGTMPVRLRLVPASIARDAVIRRPQEPRGASGYRANDVFIASPADGMILNGTLTIPEAATPARPVPGVVLVGDLGATDRDLAGAFHRPFLVLADALTRSGFAVLRLDDRGAGQTEGDERIATPEISAADAAGALAALAGTPGVDATRLGYLGLGEGAVTAAIAAMATQPSEGGTRHAPSFIVMVSPRGLPLLDSQMKAAESLLVHEGETGEYLAARLAARRRALEGAAASTTPYDAVSEPTGPIADALREEMTIYTSKGRGDASPMQDQNVRIEMAEMTTPSLVSRYRHDPGPVYQRVGLPVMVIAGREDMTNPAEANVPAVVAALQKNPAAKVSSTILPGLNQMLQPCVTGLEPERLQIETTIDPGALAMITKWLRSAAGVEK